MASNKFNESQNGSQNESQKKLVAKLIELIRINKNITRKEMAKELQVSKNTIARAIKTSEKIKYIGSAKSGYWIIEEDK